MRGTIQRSGPTSLFRRSLLAGAVALLSGCNGGGTGGSLAPTPVAAPAAPSSAGTDVKLGARPVHVALPIINGISGSLTFPAVRTPVTLSVSASATAPAPGTAVPAAVRRHAVSNVASDTLTVYEYITVESPVTITLPSLPAFALTFPASTPLIGESVFYGISDLDDRGGLVSFDTEGPGTVQAQTVSFPAIPTPITFVANHAYSFVVYATAQPSAGAVKIYVVSDRDNSVETYDGNGKATGPHITAGLNAPFGVALASGKIYVTDFNNDTITTYDANGTRTTPTITAGLSFPGPITIDAKGKIYVLNDGVINGVTTYTSSGKRTTPTITDGLNAAGGIAVDPAGSIYVADSLRDQVAIYSANGTRTGSIVAGIEEPLAVAIDARGKIYVGNANRNTITTYEPNGTRTSPTITTGIDEPEAIAVDDAGKIYVGNYESGTITTYSADGTPSTPTIGGISQMGGIAVQTIH